ncbi:MAG: hypothetical protein GY702_20245 [Desulfobulbaceae bacterium]|nr:hypothetical protein [Desulfobulbaceae bacterium]
MQKPKDLTYPPSVGTVHTTPLLKKPGSDAQSTPINLDLTTERGNERSIEPYQTQPGSIAENSLMVQEMRYFGDNVVQLLKTTTAKPSSLRLEQILNMIDTFSENEEIEGGTDWLSWKTELLEHQEANQLCDREMMIILNNKLRGGAKTHLKSIMTPNPTFKDAIDWMDEHYQNTFLEKKWENKLMRAVQLPGQSLEHYKQELTSFALRAFPAQKQSQQRVEALTKTIFDGLREEYCTRAREYLATNPTIDFFQIMKRLQMVCETGTNKEADSVGVSATTQPKTDSPKGDWSGRGRWWRKRRKNRGSGAKTALLTLTNSSLNQEDLLNGVLSRKEWLIKIWRGLSLP